MKLLLVHQNTHLVAIADDLRIIGSPTDALVAYLKFEKLCKEDGSIVLNNSKKYLYYFHDRVLPKDFIATTEKLGLELREHAHSH